MVVPLFCCYESAAAGQLLHCQPKVAVTTACATMTWLLHSMYHEYQPPYQLYCVLLKALLLLLLLHGIKAQHGKLYCSHVQLPSRYVLPAFTAAYSNLAVCVPL